MHHISPTVYNINGRVEPGGQQSYLPDVAGKEAPIKPASRYDELWRTHHTKLENPPDRLFQKHNLEQNTLRT
jgi:hypothetical protein